MTLSITVTNARYICQVSDRRLCLINRDGKPELYTDQANKSTMLSCKDSKMVVTYYGIGEDQPTATRTDIWLVKALQKSNPTNNSIKKVIEDFRVQSSEWINNLRRYSHGNDELYRHTFLFAGWVYPNDPTVFYVSNFENLKTHEEILHPWSEFVSTFSHPIPGSSYACSLHAGGDYKALNNDDINLLSGLIQNPGVQPEDIRNVIVRAIQKAADSSIFVSKNCMSSLLLSGQQGVNCHYHSPSGATIVYAPNFVGKFSMWGIEVYSGDGTPPWRIREALPTGLTKSRVRQGMRSIPAGYKTGDDLPKNLDPSLEKFLRSLPPGITENEILEAL